MTVYSDILEYAVCLIQKQNIDIKTHIFPCPSDVFRPRWTLFVYRKTVLYIPDNKKEVLRCSFLIFGATIKPALLPIIICTSAAFAAGGISRENQDENSFLLHCRCCVSAFSRCLHDLCRSLPFVGIFPLSGTMFALSAATGRNVRGVSKQAGYAEYAE